MKFTSLHSLSALSLLALSVGVGCGQQPGSSSSSSEHTGSTSQALSTGLVISAVYGGSGQATSAYKADYVELFNRGATPVSLAGLSLQYSIDTTIAWKVTALPSTATIAPGHYFLIRVYTTTTGAEDLPTVDFDQSAGGTAAPPAVNYGTGSGLVAIVTGTTALTCANPDAGTGSCSDPNIIDFVGYGADVAVSGSSTAPPKLFEGSAGAPSPNPAPGSTAGNANGLFRKNDGCTETDNNGADFEIKTYSTTVFARNSTSDPKDCSGLGDAALDVAIDVAIDTGPADTGTAPVDTGTADTGTAPTDTGPADTGTTPADTGTASDGGTDASDTGTAPSDTGTEPADTGTEPADTGTEPADTGNPQADTGSEQDTGTTDEVVQDDSSCGCRVVGESHESSMAGGLAALAIAGVLARRRRR